jgi:hypothetical protein
MREAFANGSENMAAASRKQSGSEIQSSGLEFERSVLG